MAIVQVDRFILIDPSQFDVAVMEQAVARCTFPLNTLTHDIYVRYSGLPRRADGSLVWGYTVWRDKEIRINPFLGPERMIYTIVHELGHIVDHMFLTAPTRIALKALMSPSAAGIPWRGSTYAARPSEVFGHYFTRAYLDSSVLTGWYERTISDIAEYQDLVADPIPQGGADPDNDIGDDDEPENDYDEDRDPNTLDYRPTPLADIQIIYDGDDITADVKFDQARFTSQAGPEAGAAEIRVRDKIHAYQPGYFHAGGTLELWINGRREWDGWVMTVNREWTFPAEDTTQVASVPRWWRLGGFDRNILFSRRFNLDKANPVNTAFGTYPVGASDQDVVRDVLTNYTTLEEDGIDLEAGITRVGPIDPYRSVKAVSAGQTLGKTMQFISLMNGALFFIDPDRVFRYVDDVTETAPFVLSDQPAVGQIGYRELLIEEDANELFNDALIWGYGQGSPFPVFAREESEDSIGQHGRFQFGGIESAMYFQKSVEFRADTLVNGSPSHARGHKDDAIRISATIFQSGLRVGMGVAFASIVWNFGDTPFFSDSDLIPGTFDPNTEFERLLFQIGKIESNNNYTRQNPRSYAYGRWQVMPGNWRVWGPIALGFPRSMGVAARDIDPDDWFPPPTPANQDTVVRWRMGKMYNIKGDVRRVAASWRSGASVGSRQPSQWSRGTILYVNHACVPLGYAPVTETTVLGDVPDPDLDRIDYQSSINSDDVYPVRKIDIDFPTPNAARFRVMMAHNLDVPWATQDPLPPRYPEPAGPFTEVIGLYSPGVVTDDGRPTPPVNPYPINDIVWAASTGKQINKDGEATGGFGGIYSSVGIEDGFAFNIPFNQTNCGLGPGAWSNWESREAWGDIDYLDQILVGDDGEGHFVYMSLWDLNAQYTFEVIVQGSSSISGYAPSMVLRKSSVPATEAGFGSGETIGTFKNPDAGGLGERVVTLGSTFIPAGTLQQGDWLVIGPGWESQRLEMPAYWCDSSYAGIWGIDAVGAACSAKGPRCTGMGNSGVLNLTGSPGLILRILGWPSSPQSDWVDEPSPTQGNAPTVWTGDQYRTSFPYIAGTLEISFMGVKLQRGVDYVETDPSSGYFKLLGGLSGETFITVTYMIPRNAGPTLPMPGEPDGSSGDSAIEEVIARAWAMIGTPYVLGAESLNAVDCSGLIFRIFTDSGHGDLIGNDRKLAAGYTRYFANQGRFTRNLAYARRGDLIAYSANGVRVSHIGIYIGDGRVISALTPPLGVTAHRVQGISVPVYGVLMPNYPSGTTRSGSDTTETQDNDPEETQSPTEELPPQTETTTEARVYRPRPQSMFGWGTEWDGENATMAAAAMALDRHTMGSFSDINGSPLSTPPNMRFYSGANVHTRAGTSLAQVATAWDAGWDQAPFNPGLITWDVFLAYLRGGHGAIVQGLVSALPAQYRKREWADAHALYVNEELSDGSFWVVDPLGPNAALLPATALEAYAKSLYGGQDIVTVAFTRVTPEI